MNAAVEARGLTISVPGREGRIEVVARASVAIPVGRTVCLVGESGSGKSVTALGIMRLVEFGGGRIEAGEILLAGHNLAALSQREMAALRGRRIGIVFQDPMTAFDPLFPIGEQIAEVLRRHSGMSHRAAWAEAVALLARVHIPEPAARAAQRPHALSGGMRQRAMIAMALACGPELLIADEPTTALDVTIQAQVLRLLSELQAETGMAILLITHDLGVAAQVADEVAVMYSGRIVEQAPVAQIFAAPAHPYTRGLLRSVVDGTLPRGTRLPAIPGAMPRLDQPPSGCRYHPRCPVATAGCSDVAPPITPQGEGIVACWHPDAPDPAPQALAATPKAVQPLGVARLVEVEDLHRHYPLGTAWLPGRRRMVRAVDGVTLHIAPGETFGLVGESGCGKSTLGRVLAGLERPTAGTVRFDGQDLARLPRGAQQAPRRNMQVVFQDPHGSVDPRWTVGAIIAEPLLVHTSQTAAQRRARVRELLAQVGLDPNWVGRYPHQLSGGQRQRVAIARAIALNPRFVLLDEAVSALDVSVQAQVINLLLDLKAALGLTYLFIGHGLHLVRHVSDRIGVMYLGRIVEMGPADAVFGAPAHPYTRALLAAIPRPDPASRADFAPLEGEIPSPASPPAGCRFHTRCPLAQPRCRAEDPAPRPMPDGREVACHFPL